MKFSIKDFFSKCDQIRSVLRIWSHLLKKSLMENFIFCPVVLGGYFIYSALLTDVYKLREVKLILSEFTISSTDALEFCGIPD